MSHRKKRNGQHWPLQPIMPIYLFPVPCRTQTSSGVAADRESRVQCNCSGSHGLAGHDEWVSAVYIHSACLTHDGWMDEHMSS